MRNLTALLSCVLLLPVVHAQVADAYGEPFAPHCYFVTNEGQFVDANGSPMSAQKFMSHGSSLQVAPATNSTVSLYFSLPDTVAPKRCHITMQAVGEMAAIKQPYVTDLAPGTNNYYYPHCPDGITEVKRYYAVRYDNIFPYVNQVVYSTPRGVRMSIQCEPGFNEEDLLFMFSGQDSLKVDPDGLLDLYLDEKYFKIQEAVAYQLNEDEVPIPLNWGPTWQESGTDGLVSFVFDGYDTEKTLYLQIGPPPMAGAGANLNDGLDWSTSFGDDDSDPGWGDHMGASVAGEDGSLYVTGSHIYGPFPPIPGWVQWINEDWDVFVSHYFYDPGNPDLDAMQDYSTHIGGTGDEKSKALFLNQNQNALYLGGFTASAVIPVEPNNDPNDGTYWENALKGPSDGLIMKLDPSSGFVERLASFGGNGHDVITAFTEDALGHIWFTGATTSTTGAESDCNSPTTAFPLCDGVGGNYWQPNNAGGTDAFLTCFDSGFNMVLSTFFGSSAYDVPYDLATMKVTPPLIVMVGATEGTIPQNTSGAFHLSGDGEKNGFIATFSTTGIAKWSTNLHKINSLQAAAERQERLMVAGFSHNPNNWIYNGGGPEPLPSAAVASCIAVPGYVSICDPGGGAYTDALAQGSDTYIGEFDPATGVLVWSTFIGDQSEELPAVATYQFNGVAYEPLNINKYQDIAVDDLLNFYVLSTTNKLPVEPTAYPTLPAVPFYFKPVDNSVGDDQSDITLHGFRANRQVFWSTLFGAFAPHVAVPEDWDYNYLSDGCDFGNSLALVEGEALYWAGTTGNDRFPTQCPYPGTSYCEPFADYNVRNWQACATRMSLRDITIGMADEVSASSSITIWPNPATDQVHFTNQGLSTELGTVRLFDATGRLAAEVELRNATASLGHLADGCYQALVIDRHGRVLGTGALTKLR